MKKTDSKKSILLFFILGAFCLYFFSGCGIEGYFELNAPSAYHLPYYNTDDFAEKYFEFRTANNNDSGEYSVLGTAVYYKIYTNYSTLLSNNSSISAVNTTSNGSAAATRLIETYQYKQLGTSTGTITPLISGSTAQTIRIRLMNYGSDDAYKAKISISGIEQSWLPRRTGNDYTFDFGRNNAKYSNYRYNIAPSPSDEDVSGSSDPDDNDWYVNMYAVSVGRDASYTNYYSLVTWLGTVKINSSTEDN